jgi:hypothetical protein
MFLTVLNTRLQGSSALQGCGYEHTDEFGRCLITGLHMDVYMGDAWLQDSTSNNYPQKLCS